MMLMQRVILKDQKCPMVDQEGIIVCVQSGVFESNNQGQGQLVKIKIGDELSEWIPLNKLKEI